MDEADILGRRFEFNNEFFKEPRRYGPVSLLQIGELCCECGYEIPPHVQVCCEVSFILAGEGSFLVDGELFPVREGDIFMNQKGEVHSIRSSKLHNLRFLYIGFEVGWGGKDDGLRPVFEFFSNPVRERKRRDRMDIATYFLKMLGELYSSPVYSQQMVACYLTQIMILIYRTFNPPEAHLPAPPASENVVGGTVYSVIQYIDGNILGVSSVRSIAEALGYSSAYLSHLFRKRGGMTLQSYICYKKMKKSLELMDSGRYSITQIALMLGFESVQSFSKAFKRTFGCPPSGYRSERVPCGAAARAAKEPAEESGR